MSSVILESGWTYYAALSVSKEIFAAIDRLLQLPSGLFGGRDTAVRRGASDVAVNWGALAQTHVHDTTRLPFLLAFASLDPAATRNLVDKRRDRFLESVSRIGGCDSQETPVVAALGGELITGWQVRRDDAKFTTNLIGLIEAVDARPLFKVRKEVGSHYDVVPNLDKFRKAGKTMSFSSRLIVGSIAALYNGSDAASTLNNRGTVWNPDMATGVGEIWSGADPETTRLWFRTIASYCGW